MFGVAIITLLAASVAAPPYYLIKTFQGGSGYRSKLKDRDIGDIHTIELDFPGQMIVKVIIPVNKIFRQEYGQFQPLNPGNQPF